MVIELRRDETRWPERYLISELSIVKSRFQPAALGWHQYKVRAETEKSRPDEDRQELREFGVHVFPSMHRRLHKHKPLDERERESYGPITELPGEGGQQRITDGSYIATLLGRDRDGNALLRRGSCTVLLGPRSSLKTQITFDFLRAGSRRGRGEGRGLLVSFIDNQATIVGQRRRLCQIDGCTKCPDSTRCYGRVHLLHFPPGCITTSEFMHTLESRLRYGEGKGETISRLLFWDLAQLSDRFPMLAGDSMFLPGLIDYLKYSRGPSGKERMITSLFMGASNTDIARSASAMADNVLFCWQDEKQLEEDGARPVPGVAVYADRIEGCPGYARLFFIDRHFTEKAAMVDQVKGLAKRFTGDDTGTQAVEYWCDILTHAPAKIAEIRKLQGL